MLAMPQTLPEGWILDLLDDPKVALKGIDEVWWTEKEPLYEKQVDREWKWGELISDSKKIVTDIRYCIRIERVIIGVIILGTDGFSLLEGGALCRVHNIAVNPKYRFGLSGQSIGIGKKLIQVAIQESFCHGYSGKIRLNATSDACKFYRKLGLTEIGPQNECTIFELKSDVAKTLRDNFELE